MINESNINKVGYGSWWYSQSYAEYRNEMSLYEYQKYTHDTCVQRVMALNLQKGDLIRLEVIEGLSPRRFKGEFIDIEAGSIYIQQTKRSTSFCIYHIDEIEILSKVSGVPRNVICISDYKKAKRYIR